MLTQPEPACLLVADISGYTGYLAGVELDHAQDILADLLTTAIGTLRPTFKLAKLEGDAAFMYVLTERVDGSALLDLVETTYATFRRRLRDIRASTTCACNACMLIPRLDLKFVVHHGSIVQQRVAGRSEVAGSDVIVIHRLLKNSVTERLGLAAYALFTRACLAAMGVDPVALGLREHVETYEHVGAVEACVLDLEAAWQRYMEQVRVIVPERGSWLVSRLVPVRPAQAWELLTSPAQRPRWQLGVDAVVEASTTGGRRGVGTTNHCVHGKEAVVEEILDWRPYDHVTLRSTLPMPGGPKVMTTIVLQPAAGGTIVTFRLGAPRSAKARAEMAPLAEGYAASVDASFDGLLADLSTAPADGDAAEPQLPAAERRRFMTQPVPPTAPTVDDAGPSSELGIV
jgi:uncharacterized protein YndB with AHSA1/START domain